jgi:hypothetical protein
MSAAGDAESVFHIPPAALRCSKTAMLEKCFSAFRYLNRVIQSIYFIQTTGCMGDSP